MSQSKRSSPLPDYDPKLEQALATPMEQRTTEQKKRIFNALAKLDLEFADRAPALAKSLEQGGTQS